MDRNERTSESAPSWDATQARRRGRSRGGADQPLFEIVSGKLWDAGLLLGLREEHGIHLQKLLFCHSMQMQCNAMQWPQGTRTAAGSPKVPRGFRSLQQRHCIAFQCIALLFRFLKEIDIRALRIGCWVYRMVGSQEHVAMTAFLWAVGAPSPLPASASAERSIVEVVCLCMCVCMYVSIYLFNLSVRDFVGMEGVCKN